jgi:hypothetical protein
MFDKTNYKKFSQGVKVATRMKRYFPSSKDKEVIVKIKR